MSKVIEVMVRDGTGGEVSGDLFPSKKSSLAVAKVLFHGHI